VACDLDVQFDSLTRKCSANMLQLHIQFERSPRDARRKTLAELLHDCEDVLSRDRWKDIVVDIMQGERGGVIILVGQLDSPRISRDNQRSFGNLGGRTCERRSPK
jgi:hypothetical protein